MPTAYFLLNVALNHEVEVIEKIKKIRKNETNKQNSVSYYYDGKRQLITKLIYFFKLAHIHKISRYFKILNYLKSKTTSVLIIAKQSQYSYFLFTIRENSF